MIPIQWCRSAPSRTSAAIGAGSHRVSPSPRSIEWARWTSTGSPCSACSARFLPVGFYYKTFFRPRGAWRLFERPIRALAGLGRSTRKRITATTTNSHLLLRRSGGRRRARGPQCRNRRGRSRRGSPADRRVARYPAGRCCSDARKAAAPKPKQNGSACCRARRAIPHLRIMSDTTVSGLFVENWASALKDRPPLQDPREADSAGDRRL